jgi:hypothetical protein
MRPSKAFEGMSPICIEFNDSDCKGEAKEEQG